MIIIDNWSSRRHSSPKQERVAAYFSVFTPITCHRACVGDCVSDTQPPLAFVEVCQALSTQLGMCQLSNVSSSEAVISMHSKNLHFTISLLKYFSAHISSTSGVTFGYASTSSSNGGAAWMPRLI